MRKKLSGKGETLERVFNQHVQQMPHHVGDVVEKGGFGGTLQLLEAAERNAEGRKEGMQEGREGGREGKKEGRNE